MKKFAFLFLLLASAGAVAQIPIPEPGPAPAPMHDPPWVWVDACHVIQNANGTYTIQVIVKGYGLTQNWYRIGLNAKRDAGGYDPVAMAGSTLTVYNFPSPHFGFIQTVPFEGTFAADSEVGKYIANNNKGRLLPYIMEYKGNPPAYDDTIIGHEVDANIAP